VAKNYVEKLLSSLNGTQLIALSSCFNSNTPTYTIRLKTLSPFYKGINCVVFKEDFFNKRLGILVYTDTQCSFFEFDSCNVEVYDIDVETKETRKVNVCVLSKADFKALVLQYLDIAGGEESDWEKIMKNRIKLDPQDNDILLINDGMQVDNNGDCTVGRDLYVEDEIVVDGIAKIVDTDGRAIVPDPVAGKYICGGSDFTYHLVDLPSQQEVEVITKAYFNSDDFVARVGVVYVVYDTDHTCQTYYYNN